MAKGPVITENIKLTIANVFIQHKNWRAKEIQAEVNKQLRRANPHLNPDWPGLSAIQKELTRLRKRDAERSAESKAIDELWSATDLAEYPISPEALPTVLETWLYAREKLNIPLTIREIQWVDRLYSAFKNEMYELIALAQGYAMIDRIKELTCLPLKLPTIDLEMYEMMTGQKITPERASKILGATRDEESEGVFFSEAVWKLAEETKLGKLPGVYGELVQSYKAYKEAKNERTHNQEG